MELTKDNLDTGMRGVPVGYCTTSTVDAMKGLHYVGRPVGECAGMSPEQVIYLLYHGKEGGDEEVKAFAEDLQGRASLDAEAIESIRSLPKQGHPMQLLPAALLVGGMVESVGDYREDCLNLIAKMPVIVAHVINYHAGWGECNESRPELGYMENFAQMLNAPDVDIERLTEALRLFNVLHYDHGGGNLSAFVGKAVASGLQGMWASAAAAMCALGGPRHGKANQDCLEFVKHVRHELGDDPTAEQMEKLIRERLANKQLVHGFGHAVLRVEDTRATVMYDVVLERYPDHPLVKIALLLREVASKVLKENPKIQDPYPNVDAISGTLLSAAGFSYPEYFTVLFGLSRCVGIAIQVVYERCEARDGKGTPIIRPRYFYKARTEG